MCVAIAKLCRNRKLLYNYSSQYPDKEKAGQTETVVVFFLNNR